MVDLLPSDEQREIIEQTRSFLEGRLPAPRLFRESTPPAPREHAIWDELASLGWFGITLPEEAGGVGLALAEEMLVFRELGRFLVSPAVLATALAARVAAAAGDARLAAALARGDTRAAPLLPATQQAGADALVLDAGEAQWLLGWNPEGASLWRRDAAAELQVRPAMDRAVSLHRGRLPAQPALQVAAQALPLQSIANVLVGAMLVGIAEATGDMAAEHARNREQFGKRIGEFQAIKHACADMRVRSEVAFWQVVVAALQLSGEGANAAGQAAAAKVLAADAAIRNGAATIQVHGGMGFTAELGVDAFLRRAHLLHQLGGDTRQQRAALLAGSLM